MPTHPIYGNPLATFTPMVGVSIGLPITIGGFDPLTIDPVFYVDASTSMLRPGSVADSFEFVATLDNKATAASATSDATQTVSVSQGIAVQDNGLYLPGTTGNYASVPDADDLEGFNDFTLQVSDLKIVDGVENVLLGKWGGGTNRAYVLSITSTNAVRLYWQTSTIGGNIISDDSLSTTSTFSIRVTRLGSDMYIYVDYGSGFIQLGNTIALNDLQLSYGPGPLYIGSENSSSSTSLTQGVVGGVKIWRSATPDTSSPVLDVDFTSNNIEIGATSFTADSGQVVTINQSGDNTARISKGSHLIMDLVDDEYEFTTDVAINGTIVVATTEGTYSAGISLDANTTYELASRGVATNPTYGFLKNIVGFLITEEPMSESDITQAEAYFVSKGAAARSAFGSVTSFTRQWRDCNTLTDFPLLDTSSGEDFINAWYGCTSLTSFPLIDTSLGENFGAAWYLCSSLTSFPLIDTSSGDDFASAWWRCTSLSSFPLIDTSSGLTFNNAWRQCSSLTDFPLLDTSSAENFTAAWRDCSDLTSFPVGFFDSWSPASLSNGVFNLTWDGCSSLTNTSVENILVSLAASGVHGTSDGTSGGTQLADHTIDIDYDGGGLTAAALNAIATLKTRSWEVNINNVIQ